MLSILNFNVNILVPKPEVCSNFKINMCRCFSNIAEMCSNLRVKYKLNWTGKCQVVGVNQTDKLKFFFIFPKLVCSINLNLWINFVSHW